LRVNENIISSVFFFPPFREGKEKRKGKDKEREYEFSFCPGPKGNRKLANKFKYWGLIFDPLKKK
tara:strand:- start:6111 stop:6305 length:195 start_codon:yes stop_codon:yes gene_type:complete